MGTRLLRVFYKLRSSPKVIPIMSVHTLIFLMLIDKRTPHRLEIKTVKISVFRIHQVQQINGYLVLWMSIWTHLLIGTSVNMIGIIFAKLRFVIVRVVIHLSLVMCLGALLSFVAIGVVLAAQKAGVGSESSSFVNCWVIVNTGFKSVNECFGA